MLSRSRSRSELARKREAMEKLRAVAGKFLEKCRMRLLKSGASRLRLTSICKLQRWWRKLYFRIKSARLKALMTLRNHIQPAIQRCRSKLKHRYLILSFCISKKAAIDVSHRRKLFIEKRLYCRFSGLIEGKRTRDQLRLKWIVFQEQSLLLKTHDIGARRIINNEKADRPWSLFAPQQFQSQEREHSRLYKRLTSVCTSSDSACLELQIISIQMVSFDEKRDRKAFVKVRVNDIKRMYLAHRHAKSICFEKNSWGPLIVRMGIWIPTLIKIIEIESLRESENRRILSKDEVGKRHSIKERYLVSKPATGMIEPVLFPRRNCHLFRERHTPELPTTPLYTDFHVPRHHQKQKERVLLAAKMWQLSPEALWMVLSPAVMRITMGKNKNENRKRIPKKPNDHCPTPPPRRLLAPNSLLQYSPVPVMNEALVRHDAALDGCSDRYFGTSLCRSVDVRVAPPKLVSGCDNINIPDGYHHHSRNRFLHVVNPNCHQSVSAAAISFGDQNSVKTTPRTFYKPLQRSSNCPRGRKQPKIYMNQM